MHDFKYHGRHLYAEEARLLDLAKKVGTPVYVYSRKSFHDHFFKLEKAFSPIDHLICYSLKANSNLAILHLLAKWGAGADVVSAGELYLAAKAGIKPAKIVYAGVGKREDEIRLAISKGILLFNVESQPELDLINKVSASLGRKTEVALRLNPDLEAHTHHFLTTAKKETKFGLSFSKARDIFYARTRWPYLDIVGLHVHLGSQITRISPYEQGLKELRSFIRQVLRPRGIIIKFLNLGGGLGIIYGKETPSTAANFSRHILPFLKDLKVRLVLEPGRFIAGNSGILLSQVLYIKEGLGKKFVVVDAGMSDLIRPALYSAHHEIQPLVRKSGRLEKADVVGPICESADFLALGRRLRPLSAGDYVAIMSAGAYGFTMSSNYNARLRPPEVLVEGKSFRIVRKGETYRDLLRGQVV